MGEAGAFVAELNDLQRLLDEFTKHGYTVYGPIVKGKSWVFSKVSSIRELDLNYTRTILPPKKLLHPVKNRIFDFKLNDGFEVFESCNVKNIVIFGIHPCDLRAIEKLDEFFSQHPEDVCYEARRKRTLIVGLTCNAVDEKCFCNSLGTGPEASTGFDILITQISDGFFLVEVGSSKGLDILKTLDLAEAKPEHFEAKRKHIEHLKSSFTKTADFEGLATLAKDKLDHKIWVETAERCLSCGNCSMVCPVCYCFDLYDSLDLTLKEGVRIMELDSCQLLEYAEVALGGNFRKERSQRLRHWLLCKFGAAGGSTYTSCIGCGRCIVYCPANIDLTEIAHVLKGG
ncbi:4Fe-4S dicluster domain-containing protein [Candidatus Bathyarchaeota archaeon]|nr:4Fe-4S dicluster domain-containing protein [Candidatus Bathyarchaeota archaeon]MBS7618498.1 4Fe-4S dicluster domain-containing protein [Candidatus Bathyarchaeota archaeon]